MMMSASFLTRHPLAVIVIAQLFGTSLWFSVNGVGLALQEAVGLSEGDLGLLTIAVQAGFITGTLLIATGLTGLADRMQASHLLCAVSGARCDYQRGIYWRCRQHNAGGSARFATGLRLAGIYPLGMKLVVAVGHLRMRARPWAGLSAC